MRFKTKKKYLLFLVMLCPILSLSCDTSSGGGSKNPKYNPTTVSYDMSNSSDWVKCNNACDISYSTVSYQTQDCTWCCASGYKNANRSWVHLYFTKRSGAWVLSNDFISSGICN